MKRKITVLALAALLFAVYVPAEAQQVNKVPRIGFLSANSPSAISARVEAFRQGLRELGYVEGKNIVIEYRYAEAKLDALPGLAGELIRLNVDVIVATGPTATRPAKEATNTIPIVMAQDPDPVGNGFVASLARPGGNITGLSSLIADLSGKRLELLKEILPGLLRVAVFQTSTNAGNARQLRETDLAGRALKVKLQYLDVVGPKDIESAFRAASNGRADAILMLSSPVFTSERTQIVNRAAKSRLPAIYPGQEFVQEGALMTYSVSVIDMYRRAAIYVDKILKGAKPADLPVEQPKKFEFIINLKTAKQIGVTIPPSVLYRADKVIK